MNNHDIIGFIKIGKSDHLKDLQKGSMYFSPVVKFQKMEEEQQNRGRGDINEGRNVIDAFNVKYVEVNKDGSYKELMRMPQCKLIVSYGDIDQVPIFCLMMITKENIVNGKVIIKENDYDRITKDLTESDSALLIFNSKEFLENIFNNIGVRSFSHPVFYINEESVNFLNFINADDTIKIGGSGTVSSENFHKTLFKKDTYFSHQKEYRIVLPNERTFNPKVYKINPISNSKIVRIEDLKKGIEIKDY